MISLENVVKKGEGEARAGQTALMVAGLGFLLDIVLFGIIGLTTPWLIIPIAVMELVGMFMAFYYMFGTLSNIFAVSRASSTYNMQYVDQKRAS